MGFIVNNTTFLSPVDLIAPHSCRGCGDIGSPLCGRCKNYILSEHHNLCPNCKSSNPTGICPKCPSMPPTFTVANRTSSVGLLVHDLKYTSSRSLAKPLAELANSILPDIIGPVVIVPLPTISRHIRERGFDHTLEISRRLAKLRPDWHVEKVLLRARDSVQVGATESARLSQAKKAYQINSKNKIDPSATYLLFDDVWTTGASMKAAHKILTRAGIRKTMMLILAVSHVKH